MPRSRRKKANPAIKLPSKYTPAQIRVNEQGKVQIRINPSKIGSGGRFAKCVESVEAKGGAVDPRAVCAAAGRRKYGAKKFSAMARAGRKRAKGNPSKPKYTYSWDLWPGGETDEYEFETLADAQRAARRGYGGPGSRVRIFRRHGSGPYELRVPGRGWIPQEENPSKRKVLKRVRKALTKYVRSQNPKRAATDLYAAGLSKREIPSFIRDAKQKGWKYLRSKRALMGRGYAIWGVKP